MQFNGIVRRGGLICGVQLAGVTGVLGPNMESAPSGPEGAESTNVPYLPGQICGGG